MRATVPGPGPAPWSGAGPWGSGCCCCCCCSAPRCPRGRAPRKVQTPAPDPPSPGRAGTLLPEPAFLRRPLRAPLSSAPVSSVARASTGQANLWSLTPNSCFHGPVIPAPAGQQFTPGGGVRAAASRPPPQQCGGRGGGLCPDSPSLRCPTQRSEHSEVRGGKAPYCQPKPGDRETCLWGKGWNSGCRRPSLPALLPQLPRLRAVPCTPLHNPSYKQSRPFASGGSLLPRNHR